VRRISSRATFFYKRVFPMAFFGIPLFVALAPLLKGSGSGQLPLSFLGMLALFFVFAYVVMRMLVFDLVDEVWEDGDALIVHNGASKARIALTDIKNVNYSPLVSPPRVTLSLRRSSIFGPKVTFCAPLRFIPFTTSPLIDELIDRIDAAREP